MQHPKSIKIGEIVKKVYNLKKKNSLIKSTWLGHLSKTFVEGLYSLAFVRNIEVWENEMITKTYI